MSDLDSQSLADMTVESVLADCPGAVAVFLRHGMACVGCVMARFETLAEAAGEYRLDLGELLRELRAARLGAEREVAAGAGGGDDPTHE